MSNSAFISAINEQIEPLLMAFTGFRLFGIAQGMIRKVGDQPQLIPCLVNLDGEGTYVGLDDAAPITIYHKSNSIAIADKPNSGVGDSRANSVNTYQNSLIVFLNRRLTKLLPDEFILVLHANLKDGIKIPKYKTINIRLQNIILNSQQVFASEYQGFDYRIPPHFSLFAINYQIESVFDKSCFATCP